MNQPNPPLASLLDSATQVAIIATDCEGTIKAFNKGAELMLGYRADEVIDKIPLWHFHRVNELNDLSGKLSASHQIAIAPEAALTYEALLGRPGTHQWTYLKKDGSPLSGILTLSATYDADGKMNGLLAFILPATGLGHEIKLAEAKLRASEQRLHQAQEIVGIGSWDCDLKARKVNFSEQAFRIYEITDEAEKERLRTHPKEIIQFVHPSDAKYVERMARLLMEKRDTIQIEHQIIARNGQTKYLISIARFCFDPMGEPEKIIGTIQDITEQKQRELELTEARFQAEQITLQKQQFLSTMSHEIRTPLNAVIGITRLLQQNDPRPDQVEDLRMLQFSSENLLQLANDILDFSKLEVGKTTFEEVDFNLRELLASIRHSFSYSILHKPLRIHTRLDSQLPDWVVGDPIRLSQVMNNLLGNSVKFTETGSITMEVLVDAEDNDFVTLGFSVTDTGIGIPGDRLEFIFESFVQASTGISRTYGGAGLGLAITKRLLELQGSRIYVESTEGKGSRFFFHLRFKKSYRSQPAEASKKTLLSSFAHVRLLLVEDNDINQMLATKFLNQWGIEPDLAPNGRVALEKVRVKEYDLILMDLQMPEMNGYEATAAIRDMTGNGNQRIPIIALTAASLHEIVNRAKAVGITDFLVKPFDPHVLHRLIGQYVSAPPFATPPTVHQTLASQIHSANQILAEENIVFSSLRKLPEMNLQEQLLFLRASEKLFQEFKATYQKSLASGDLAQLNAANHRMKVVFELLDARQMTAEVEIGRNLLTKGEINQPLVNSSISRMQALCDAMVSQLHACLESITEKVS